MGKGTNYRYNLFQERGGTALSKSDDYTITSDNILVDGYGHFKQTGSNKKFTLPTASTALKGCSIYVTAALTGTTKVYVAAGFGGNTDYDTATLAAYETAEFWTNGSSWFALNDSVAAS